MDLTHWYSDASGAIAEQLGADPLIAAAAEPSAQCAVHLAVFIEPFLSFVLDGSKRVESRFSTVKVAPFRAIRGGDLVLLKEVAGPIVAATLAVEVWSFGALTPATRSELRTRFGPDLRDDVPGFWEQREEAQYATLIQLGSVARLPTPLACPKTDRRGWVVLRERPHQLSLFA